MMLSVLALLGWMWMAPPCEPGFCRCALPRDVASEASSAAAVFTGRVVSVRDTAVQTSAGGWMQRVVTLRVDHAWKGVESDSVAVLAGGGRCGFQFERGESYLVFANGLPGESPWTGACGRTAELSRAAADLRELGEPARRWPG
jgi:hypothetical protein